MNLVTVSRGIRGLDRRSADGNRRRHARHRAGRDHREGVQFRIVRVRRRGERIEGSGEAVETEGEKGRGEQAEGEI